MKKLLGIVVLGLLWCNVGFADHCGHDLDRSWDWSSGKTHMEWTIKNKTNKSIVITSVGLWAKDNETEMFRKRNEYYIKPFGVKKIRVYVGDLNLDVSGSGFTSCRYGTISTTNTYKPPKKKKSGNTQTTIAAWVIGIGFIFIVGYLWYDAQNPNNKKTERVKVNNQQNKRSSRIEESLISKVWNGNETMSKTFWLYCILTTFIISFVSGFVLASHGALIFIIPVIVIIWSNTGLWRSSEVYKNQKLRTKQPYGWSIAAKVYVVLNYITTLSQIGLALNV